MGGGGEWEFIGAGRRCSGDGRFLPSDFPFWLFLLFFFLVVVSYLPSGTSDAMEAVRDEANHFRQAEIYAIKHVGLLSFSREGSTSTQRRGRRLLSFVGWFVGSLVCLFIYFPKQNSCNTVMSKCCPFVL